jgi:hypothetical protein
MTDEEFLNSRLGRELRSPQVSRLHMFENFTRRALYSDWIAYNVVQWMIAWPGGQRAQVQRVLGLHEDTLLPGFSRDPRGGANVDLEVLHADGVDVFKVRVDSVGSVGTKALKLTITHQVDGKEEEVWHDVGVQRRTPDEEGGFWQLIRVQR